MALDNYPTPNSLMRMRHAISQDGCENIWHDIYLPFLVESVQTALWMKITSSHHVG